MSSEEEALRAAADVMEAKLQEILGPNTVNTLSAHNRMSLARATIDAYLRAKIIANRHSDEGGEP
jgi:hypothetical protein